MPGPEIELIAGLLRLGSIRRARRLRAKRDLPRPYSEQKASFFRVLRAGGHIRHLERLSCANQPMPL